VIDRGTWAQFFQRHLLHTACETYEFLRHKWGVPDEAQKYQRQASAMLKDLTLYPLTVEYLGQPEGEPTQVRAADLVNRYPELVSDGGWEAVARSVPERLARGGSWQAVARAWFSPVLPTNTAYGFYARAGSGKVLPKMTGAGVEAAHRVAPLHFGVCEAYAAALSPGGRTTAAAYEQALAPLLPYYATAMWHEAKLVKDDPSHYASLMSRAAAQDPVFHVILGRYEVDHHLDAQAAREFQSAIDQRADAVTVASISGWLANYYFDHGQKEQALAIASAAAQVYSEEGLEAMAGLLDKMGRTEEAESYFEKIRERYGNSTPLQAFYDRHAATSPEYARKMRAGQEELFPAGIHPVALAQLAGKPTHGVLVQGANDLSQRYGLQPGAIIVGLDGKRVDNMPQYMYVRGLSATPMLDLLVYQDGRYQEIHANVPGRQFGLRFVTWPEERSE
jgi:tetratricopeptide (TPR) repeat protein